MSSRNNTFISSTQEDASSSSRLRGHRRSATKVTQARAKAQRAKINQEAQQRHQQEPQPEAHGQEEQSPPRISQARRRATMTVERAIGDYLDDHIGGNHSEKTVEWHRTALGLLQAYLEKGRELTLVAEIDAPDITHEMRNEMSLESQTDKER